MPYIECIRFVLAPSSLPWGFWSMGFSYLLLSNYNGVIGKYGTTYLSPHLDWAIHQAINQSWAHNKSPVEEQESFHHSIFTHSISRNKFQSFFYISNK